MQPIINQSIVKNCSFINGRWLDSSTYFEVSNPADLSVIAKVCEVQAEQVIQAINAADNALPGWQELDAAERSVIINRWQLLIRENVKSLAPLLTLEQGKPLAEAEAEIIHAAEYTRIYAEVSNKLFSVETIDAQAGQNATVIRRPVGVVSAITPWNFPCSMVLRKAAAAISAGCCVVLKPSELTPLTSLALAELSKQAGLPDGVFNVVVGSSAQAIGEMLSQNPKVAKLSFTGSTETGNKLLTQCANGVKRTSLELGGNAPFLVFEDADIEQAVEGAMASKFRNAGQTCVSANRFLIHKNILAEFKRQLIAKMTLLKIGSGTESETTIGPLINQSAVKKLSQLQASAVEQGANVCYTAPLEEKSGYFFPPTVIENVLPHMSIFEQEIFGPIVCLTSFDSELQAIELANQTDKGLCGYFYSKDFARQKRLTRLLEFGMLGINQAKLSNPAAPFGGFKQSGMGREGGRFGVEEYLDYQYLCQPE